MDQGVRTVNAEQFHPLIAGADDRTVRGIHSDNLRGKDSCDAGRRSGKRNGVCWKNATLDAADVHRVGQIRVQDAEAGAVVASERRVGMLCSGARGGVCERGSYFLVFTRLLWRRLLAEQKGSVCGSGQMVPDLVCQRCERIPIRNLVRFRAQQANRPLLSGGISAFVLAT